MICDCSFCREFAKPPGEGWSIVRSERFVLMPTLGCFTHGYSLVMPVDHVYSFGEVVNDPDEACSLEVFLNDVRALVESRFGPTIIAEHGSGGQQDMGAACCQHAHLHLIPAPDKDAVLRRYCQTGGKPAVLNSIRDLALQQGSYIYLAPSPEQHLVWPARRFPCQFVRRVLADLHGLQEYWDWQEYPFWDKRVATLKSLLQAIEDTAVLAS